MRSFRPVGLDAYLAAIGRRQRPTRSVLVTIDDGYRSTLEVAAPLLARYGVPAVLFLPPARLGGSSEWMPEMPSEPLMDESEARAIQDHGVELGVHGLDHTLLPGLPPDELRQQVSDARRQLADITGRVPRAFAYPEGAFDGAAVRAVQEAGYDAAFSVHATGFGRFTIPRRPVTTRDSATTFVVKLLPGFNAAWNATARHRWVRRVAAAVARQRPDARSSVPTTRADNR